MSRKKQLLEENEQTGGQGVQRLRADARRNRVRVLEAARGAFAEQGLEVQMEEIARRAQVGVGTIYRHFPTKDALLEALLIEKYTQVIHLLQALEQERDPWTGCSQLVYLLVEQYLENQALIQIAEKPEHVMQETDEVGQRMIEMAARFITRAQAAGKLRKDVDVEDIMMLVCGIVEAMNYAPKYDKSVRDWKHYVAILLDGLHTPC